eukprot:COSAG01_NODE_59313_length_301_cov_0.514851_1_plen_32_part_01
MLQPSVTVLLPGTRAAVMDGCAYNHSPRPPNH